MPNLLRIFLTLPKKKKKERKPGAQQMLGRPQNSGIHDPGVWENAGIGFRRLKKITPVNIPALFFI
jgi:hypothetical protein